MDKHTVILISGKQGSGKSTTSTKLAKELFIDCVDSVSVKFAEVLYGMHDAALAVAASYGIPVLAKESTLLQLIGTEWGRNTKGQNVWVDAVKHKVLTIINESTKPMAFIIDDCRFENEFHSFDELEAMGVLNVIKVRLEAPESERQPRTDSWRSATEHHSEIGLDNYSKEDRFDLLFQTGTGGFSTGDIVDEIIYCIREREALSVGADPALIKELVSRG
jgi:DNA polymerase III delta prime subunit